MGDKFLAPNSAGAGAETAEGGGVSEDLLPVYAGKWTQEEEEYAQFLMEEFRAGNIPNLENGASMRTYLAKMLICRPKRVTKKYERSGYNGKLTYQANLVKLSPQEAKDRHQQLVVLRAKFITSRKQRLCITVPTTLKPPHHTNPPAMAGVASLRSSAPSMMTSLGVNSLPLQLSGVDSFLGGADIFGATSQPFLHGGASAWMPAQLIGNMLATAPTAGQRCGTLPSVKSGLEGLGNQRSLHMNPMASVQPSLQRGPLLNSSLFLPRQRMALGANNFISDDEVLRQQHVLVQLQIENGKRTNEIIARHRLMAELQMEKERKVALERALVEQYQRNAVARVVSGALNSSEHESRDTKRAGLKRTGEDAVDGVLQQMKKPRGL